MQSSREAREKLSSEISANFLKIKKFFKKIKSRYRLTYESEALEGPREKPILATPKSAPLP